MEQQILKMLVMILGMIIIVKERNNNKQTKWYERQLKEDDRYIELLKERVALLEYLLASYREENKK